MKVDAIITIVVAIVLVIFFCQSGQAAEVTHCVKTGGRTTCFSTDSYTKKTTRITKVEVGSVQTTTVVSRGYQAEEIVTRHGRSTTIVGRDSDGRRWSQHGVDVLNVGTIADTSSIASDMSIAR